MVNVGPKSSEPWPTPLNPEPLGDLTEVFEALAFKTVNGEVEATIVMRPSLALAWMELVKSNARGSFKRILSVRLTNGRMVRLLGCFPMSIESQDEGGGPKVFKRTVIEDPVEDGSIQVGDGSGSNVVLNKRIVETPIDHDCVTVEIRADEIESVFTAKPQLPGPTMVWE